MPIIDREVLRKEALKMLRSRKKAVTTRDLADAIAAKFGVDRESVRKRLSEILRSEERVRPTVIEARIKRKGSSYTRLLQAWRYETEGRGEPRIPHAVREAHTEELKRCLLYTSPSPRD